MGMGSFPTGYVKYPTTPVVDGDIVYADHVYRLYEEFSGVEVTLGTGVQGTFPTVRERLEYLQTGYEYGQSNYVVKAASSTDDAIVRFDGSTGKLIQNSSVTLNDASVASGFEIIYSKQYGTTLNSQTGGSVTVNWNDGTSQNLDFTGVASGTYTISFSNGIPGSAYVLTTTQNTSGTVSLAWSGTQVKWQGAISGTVTATSGAIDMFSFYYNGSNYLGTFSNNYA